MTRAAVSTESPEQNSYSPLSKPELLELHLLTATREGHPQRAWGRGWRAGCSCPDPRKEQTETGQDGEGQGRALTAGSGRRASPHRRCAGAPASPSGGPLSSNSMPALTPQGNRQGRTVVHSHASKPQNLAFLCCEITGLAFPRPPPHKLLEAPPTSGACGVRTLRRRSERTRGKRAVGGGRGWCARGKW